MRKYDAILIDADDTLFDFGAAERRALKALLNEMALDLGEAAPAYHRANDACWDAVERGTLTQSALKYKRFEDFLAAVHRSDDPVAVGDRYIDLLAREGILLPGALDVVREIARARPVAIVTNGISKIQHGRMAASGLNQYVTALIISEDVGAAKPNRAMIDAALHALGGIAPGRALMVGDSLTSDMRCAMNAGTDACWLNPAGKPVPEGMKVDYVISDIRALPPIALADC